MMTHYFQERIVCRQTTKPIQRCFLSSKLGSVSHWYYTGKASNCEKATRFCM